MKSTSIIIVSFFTSILTPLLANAQNNIVIIHVDDLGWRDLSCMGSPVYETPNIGTLSKSGTRYTDAYAAAPLCTPSRACLLTGSQPSRHGVYTVVKNRGTEKQWKVIPKKNKQFIPKDIPTIGTVLTKAGIANGAIGKWHVAAKVPSHGFKEGTLGGYLGMPINYFAPFKLGFLPKNVPDGSYLPTYIREAGIDFIERHKNEQFFLYFSTYLPHDEIKNEDGNTLTAPKNIVQKYEKKIATMKQQGKDLEGHTNPIYAAMIEETDRSVGAIIDTLDKLKLRENTLIVFISDNGGHLNYTSNAPLRGGKCTLYEGGIRVPMIVSMPGKVKAGATSNEPVSGIDLYPTICNIMKVKPIDPKKVDGEDLTKLFFESQSLGERNLFWNFPSYNNPNAFDRRPRNVLRRGNWKLHFRYEDGGYELYNLKNDIGEAKDLCDSEPQVLEIMKQQLQRCYQRFGTVETLPENPKFDPSSRQE